MTVRIKTSFIIFSLAILLYAVFPENQSALSSEKAPVKPLQTTQQSSPSASSTILKTKGTASGKTEQKIQQYRQKKRKSNSYTKWKRHLPFWIRKIVIFTELAIYIFIGVILGQMLEVAGIVKYIAIITKPLLFSGKLPSVAGPPFILALQSGAVANSMLVNARDEGELSNRQLYTSVLVVSCLSLFAHLPTYILPLAVAFGSYPAWLFFSIRFGAIILEILVILLISNLLVRHFTKDNTLIIPKEERLETKKKKKANSNSYFGKVWLRSRKTIKRILIYTTPSFFSLALLEYLGGFKWLSNQIPEIFTYSFLPPEATAIIPAQAINLYNGIITAGNFLDENKITAIQAVIILLCGSVITSPIRTLKHALPTYIGILGPRTGVIMAVSAQLLRIIFTVTAIIAAIIYFNY